MRNNELLFPFLVPTKKGETFDVNSLDWSKLLPPLRPFGVLADSTYNNLGVLLTHVSFSLQSVKIGRIGITGNVVTLNTVAGRELLELLKDGVDIRFRLVIHEVDEKKHLIPFAFLCEDDPFLFRDAYECRIAKVNSLLGETKQGHITKRYTGQQ